VNLSSYNSSQFQEVIDLFTTVSSNSEGNEEGLLIGELVPELITTTSTDAARGLFAALQEDISDETVILDVPENNPLAMLLARKNAMREVFATMRMYQKQLPDIDHSRIYGITTFELG